MAKPERIPAKGVSVFIDGMLTKRIQTVGVNIDVTREQVLELANEGVIENVRDNDSVTVQLDTVDVGSTDTLALLVDKMIPYEKDQQDHAADPRNRGTDHKFMIKAASSNASYRTITASDLLDNYSNILVANQENTTAVARVLYAPRCSVTNMSLSYDVSGNAAENYTLLTDKKVWFLNASRGVRLYKPVFSQVQRDFTASTISFVGLHSCIPVTATVVAVLLNDRLVFDGAVSADSTALGSWDITTNIVEDDTNLLASSLTITHISAPSGGLPFATPWVATASGTSSRSAILWYGAGHLWEADGSNTEQPGYELESTSGALGAIRKGQIKARLFNQGNDDASATANAVLRLQTVSIDVSPGEERLFELGRQGHYGVAKTSPVPISISVTAIDSDIEYYAMLLATAKGTVAGGPTVLNSDDFTVGNNKLIIDIYKESSQINLLKTITINDMSVTTENFGVAVGEQASQELSFTADNITIVGSGFNVTGGWYGGG